MSYRAKAAAARRKEVIVSSSLLMGAFIPGSPPRGVPE